MEHQRPISRQDATTAPIAANFEPGAHVRRFDWSAISHISSLQRAFLPANGIAGGLAGLKVEPDATFHRAPRAIAI